MAGNLTGTILNVVRRRRAASRDDDDAGIVAVASLANDFLSKRSESQVVAHSDWNLDEELARYDFACACDLRDVAEHIFKLLSDYSVRSDHPRYFGLFNPPAKESAIAGDLIAATVNPQLAVWSHAPAAAQIESKLVQFMGQFIWPGSPAAGTFTSGGTEANHTALLVALAKRYPNWTSSGLQSLDVRPAIYASSESHLAWIKIARSAGLGSESVRLIKPRDGLALTGDELSPAIAGDPDLDPVLVVGTAGTTAHGAVDDLQGLSDVAARHGAHFHVDAAWAGGGLLHPDVRAILAGLGNAHSVTLDPHKWLAVPMACGMYLTPGWQGLQQAFSVSTSYMPPDSIGRHDAYIHSLQWSRRFIGLKLFMALATEGISGYQSMIQHQLELGDYLRSRLEADGWQINNASRLPLVCFSPSQSPSDDLIVSIEKAVSASGRAWISTVRLRGALVLRACITSFESTRRDVDVLLGLLAHARAAASQGK